MLLAAADADAVAGNESAATAHRVRAASLARGGRDPHIVALHVRALAALGRYAEAAPLATRLLATGYRDGNIAVIAKDTATAPSNPAPQRVAL
jgi:hypothetical protein